MEPTETVMKKPPVAHPALQTWIALNMKMRVCDEKTAERLLEMERNGRARKMFMMRIHSRINRLRRKRERSKILELVD